MDVHFIGVGKMGLPMALHLQRAGHAVQVSDVGPAQLAQARAQGLHVATGSQRDLAAAQVIFSSLPDDDALRTVGSMVAHNAAPGAVYVDTSTVSQAASAQVAQACLASGVAVLRRLEEGDMNMGEGQRVTGRACGPRLS